VEAKGMRKKVTTNKVKGELGAMVNYPLTIAPNHLSLRKHNFTTASEP